MSTAHSFRKKILTLLVGLLSFAVIYKYSRGYLHTKSRVKLLTGPMLQIPAPGTISIIWEMDASQQNAAAELQSGGKKITGNIVHEGKRYCADFTNVSQGTTYLCTLHHRGLFGMDQLITPPFDVQSPPPHGKSFRFLAFGDSGNGSNTQSDLAKVMIAAKPDLIIHCGDLIYPSGEINDYPANFFEPYAELIRRIPFMPSLGNHDVATEHGKAFLDVFDLPRNGPPGIELERNYWFDFGDARFVALDSNPPEENGTITADQRANVIAPWLKQTLAQSTARWKFVYFHHPFYTNSEHPESGGEHMKKPFVHIFEETNVDMVFCGHNHIYERTSPIRADVVMPEGKGVVYITSGAAGANRYKESQPPPAYMKSYNDDAFCFTQVDLSPDKLELQQVAENGKVVDRYTINKSQMTLKQ